jgi:NAD(P)-dependent dehydrogenase (short-subunit alcohol dehydrogenase family)
VQDLFSIKDKVAVVTGGSRGIGFMIANGYANAGARKVYISSRKEADLNEAAAEISKSGPCEAVPADLSTEEGAKTLADAVRAQESGIDILVNNAGATWGAPFEEFPASGWDRVLDINVKGPFFLTKELHPQLKANATDEDPSRIINVGSVAAFGEGGVAFSYGASKAAIHQMTKNWASQFAADRITVNAIAPGPFPSKMMAFLTDNEEARTMMEARVPLGRIGSPEDMAGLTIFLASRASAWMTGCIIPIDGGRLIASGASL